MDCQVCEVRSSVGYCVECQKILCETCGVTCENCGKLSCPDHIHETSSGRVLCKSCYDERREKRKQMKAAHAKKGEGDTSLEGLEAADDEGDIGDEALVASARRPIQPWQFSVYIASAGIVVALLALFIDALRRIPMGGNNYINSGWIFLIIPVLAIIWAVVGLTKEEYYEDRPKCFYGLAASVVAAVLTLVVIVRDPGPDQTDTGLQDVRQSMSEEELQQWREDTLNQYQR